MADVKTNPQEKYDLAARAFVAKFEDNKRKLMHSSGDLYEYEDGTWKMVSPADVANYDPDIYEACNEAGIVFATRKQAVWTTINMRVTKPGKKVQFDAKRALVCGSQTLMLDTPRKLVPHDPEHYATRSVDCEYDPKADCPMWQEILNRILEDDRTDDEKASVISFLQEWFGVSIVGGLAVANNRELRKGLILVGPHKTGKTTIAEVFRAVLGTDQVVPLSAAGLGKEFGLEQLVNAAALVSDDGIGEKTRVDAEVLKRLVTGEAQTANRKYKSAVTFRFNGAVMFTTNSLPKADDSTNALYDRLVILNLTRQFLKESKRDKEIKGKHGVVATLKNEGELPGILNWALAGYDRAIERGRLKVPKSAIKLSIELRKDNDPVYAFLAECCVADDGIVVSAAVLGKIVSQYAKDVFGWELSQRTASIKAGKVIKDIIPGATAERISADGNQYRAYSGVKLNALGLTYFERAKQAGLLSPDEKSNPNVKRL